MKIKMKRLFIGSVSAIGAYTLVNTYRVHHVKKILTNYNMNHQSTPLVVQKVNAGPKLQKNNYNDVWSTRDYIRLR